MSKRWYVVQAYSGFEKNVQKTLKERIAREGMDNYFGQVLVPVEEVVDIKNGRKTISERKFFPGYVLVEMEMTDDSWHLVKSTPRVSGFIGGKANRPQPISQREVDAILQQVKSGVEKPKPKVEFEVGQQVRVNEGPFVIKRNGLYYMTYSANSYESPFYGIGCATATDLMGTWTKYEENPLLQKPGELVGVGHSATFTDKAGKLRIVFHAHKDKSSIHPRAMYISDVSFEKVDGVDRMRISKDYMTPKIVK